MSFNCTGAPNRCASNDATRGRSEGMPCNCVDEGVLGVAVVEEEELEEELEEEEAVALKSMICFTLGCVG